LEIRLEILCLCQVERTIPKGSKHGAEENEIEKSVTDGHLATNWLGVGLTKNNQKNVGCKAEKGVAAAGRTKAGRKRKAFLL
jgi:hypothetical protein